jgi:plastocyanin
MLKRLVVLPLAAAAALGLASLPTSGVAKASSSTSVKLRDNSFSPKTKTVKQNTTVVFTWAGHAPHNVTVAKGPVKFHSNTQTKGTYKKRFTRKGTYRIVCTIHPGMELTLKVK